MFLQRSSFLVLAVSCEVIRVQFVVAQIDVGPKIKLTYHVGRHLVLVAANDTATHESVWSSNT